MKIFTKLVLLTLGLLSALTVSATRFTVLVGRDGTNRYNPAALTINVGDEVEFKYASGFHPTMSDSSPALWQAFTLSAQEPSKVIPASAFAKTGDYAYHCTAHFGMNGTITVLPALATATTAPGAANLLGLFPNPSRGTVNVTLSERRSADYKLRLRNIIGKEVRTVALRPELMSSAGLTLDLSDLPAGLYFYSLLVDNKAVLTKRLTLQ